MNAIQIFGAIMLLLSPIILVGGLMWVVRRHGKKLS